MAFVLDSALAAMWIVPGDTDLAIEALLDRLPEDRVAVPPVWTTELADLLLAVCREQGVRRDEVLRQLEPLRSLPIEVDDADADVTLEAVMTLASEHRLSAGQAAYIELARRRRLPLATIDRKLRAVCARLDIPVLPAQWRS